MSDAIPANSSPFHSPYAKPNIDIDAEKPNSGGCEEMTEVSTLA